MPAKVKAKSNRIPVAVEQATHELFKQYTEITGVPIARAVDDALNYWYATVGTANMETLAKRAHGKPLLPQAKLRRSAPEVVIPAPVEQANVAEQSGLPV